MADGRPAPGFRPKRNWPLRFGVNRHTIRRALAALVEEGLVRTRRGAGAFVAAVPTDYPIGARVRFRQSMEAAGRVPGRRVLSSETCPSNDERGADPAATRRASRFSFRKANGDGR